MAKSANRIGSATSANKAPVIKSISIGGPKTGSERVTPKSGSVRRPTGLGPRGKRVLPADFPMEMLDHSAPRGTYVDLLV